MSSPIMDNNMELFRRGCETTLPNDPEDAPMTMGLKFAKVLADLNKFRDNPAEQEAWAMRFVNPPEFVESPPESPRLGPMGIWLRHPPLGIFSDPTPETFNRTDGHKTDNDGAYKLLLTEELLERLQTGCSSSSSEGDMMDEDKENVPIRERIWEPEDDSMDADADDEGEDGDDETSTVDGSEAETENFEEEFRGRNRLRKRLNCHADRSLSGPVEVHRPLKKKSKATVSSDSDVPMEDADDTDTGDGDTDDGDADDGDKRNIATSDGEYCADDLLLPPLTRTTKREPMS